MQSSSGLLGGVNHDMEMARATQRKLHRVRNYKDSFQKYESGIRALEFDMYVRLRALSGDTKALADEMSMTEEELLTCIKYLEMPQEMLEGIKEQYGEEAYARAVDLLTRTTDGIYGFEELLRSEEITESDVEILANVYEILFERVEMASNEAECIQEKRILEVYLESLYKLETDQVNLPGNGMPYYVPYVGVNDTLIERLSYYVEDEERLASQVLSSLNGSKIEILECWFADAITIDELGEIQLVDVDIDFTDLGIVMGVTACPNASNRGIHSAEGTESYRLNSIIKTAVYVDALGQDILDRMEGLGYSEENIVQMYMLTENETDVVLLGNLYAGEYEQVFIMNPDEFSGAGKTLMTQYANGLLYTENGCEELTNFINELLHTDEERCLAYGTNNVDEFIAMLKDSSYALCLSTSYLTEMAVSSDMDSEVFARLREDMEHKLEMQGLWAMLLEATQTEYFTNLDTAYYNGDITYKISNLAELQDANGLRFEIGVYTQDGEMTYMQYKGTVGREQLHEIDVIVAWNPTEINTANTLAKIDKLYQELGQEKAEALFNSATELLTLGGNDELKNISDILKKFGDLYQGDTGFVAEDITGALDDKFGLDNIFGGVLSVGSELADYSELEEKYSKKIDEECDEWMMETFGSCTVGKISGNTIIINSGVYDPYTQVKLSEWKNGGLQGLTGEAMSVKVLEDIANSIGYKEESSNYAKFCDRYSCGSGNEKVDIEELQECLDMLIYGDENGKSILDYDGEVLVNAFMELDGSIGGNCIDYLKESVK